MRICSDKIPTDQHNTRCQPEILDCYCHIFKCLNSQSQTVFSVSLLNIFCHLCGFCKHWSLSCSLICHLVSISLHFPSPADNTASHQSQFMALQSLRPAVRGLLDCCFTKSGFVTNSGSSGQVLPLFVLQRSFSEMTA